MATAQAPCASPTVMISNWVAPTCRIPMVINLASAHIALSAYPECAS